MQYHWLQKKSAHTSVIVLFSGWGFGPEVVQHIVNSNDGYDVLFVHDYRDLSTALPDLSTYQQRYLLAWSFGVASFAAWFQQHEISTKKMPQFERMVAINGSMSAIDRYQGIPGSVMQKTIDTLSQQSFAVFAKRCGVDAATIQHLTIDVPARKSELEIIQTRQHPLLSGWDHVWIGSKDKIFPAKNVLRAWEAYNQKQAKPVFIKYFDSPHVPFHLWSHWDEIVLTEV